VGVFANGLEVSGKAVDAKTIAAFPDVCFTPPENPATPPGVPVPYPSFGMAGDTDKGTSTVKIEGKTVNLKNKSYLTKTTGTEAGAAAKKGIITSKNTGKEYFNSWSNNVKYDGEPVIRMSDLATNNHASPTGNTVTWPHVAKLEVGPYNCEALLNELKIHLHAHSDNPCGNLNSDDSKFQSEHMIMNSAILESNRGLDRPIAGFDKYSGASAPCVCMEGPGHSNNKSAHGRKTKAQYDFFRPYRKSKTRPKLGDLIDHEVSSIGKNHRTLKGAGNDQEQNEKVEAALQCIKLVIEQYFEWVTGKEKEEMRDTEVSLPNGGKLAVPPEPRPMLPPTSRTFG